MTPLTLQPYYEPGDPVICAQFGCAVVLRLHEQLAGKYCVHHMKRNNPDPTMHISYPIKNPVRNEIQEAQLQIDTLLQVNNKQSI